MARIEDPRTNTTVVTGERRSGGSLWFIVGALVVAVAVLAYFFLGDGDVATAPTAGGDVNVTVGEGTGDTAPVDAAPVEAAPVDAAPVDAAPAEGAPAEAPAN